MDNVSLVTSDKMYFANNNGKIPKDVNGNIVLTKNITDATIYVAFDQFNDSKVAMACKGFMQYKNGTNKHVLVVHGDDSLTEPEEKDCVGTIYSVTLSEPIEFRYHGHRGFGQCQLPKIYTVKEEALKDAKIEKVDMVSFKATFEYDSQLSNKVDVAALEEMESIKKITFPPSEIETIKKQDRIITTRVSADYDKFHEGDLVETPWKAIYKVIKRLEINSIEKHPYYSELTKQQIAYLEKHDKIAILTLEKNNQQLKLHKCTKFTDEELKPILEGVNLSADASNDPKWTMQDLKKYLEVKPNIFFIKKEEEKIGIVFLGIDGGHNEIGSFAIFRKYQGKGYGLQALKVIIDYLRKLHPGKDIELGVAEKNIKAVNLYKKLGFKVVKKGTEDGKVFYRMQLKSDSVVSKESLSDEKAPEIKLHKCTKFTDEELNLILEGINLAAGASNDPRWTLAELKERMETAWSNRSFYLIQQESEYIGFVCVGRYFVLEDRDGKENKKCKAASIYDFAIFQKFQGKGLGERSLRYVINEIRKRNSEDWIVLGVTKRNERAKSLYQKVGFKVSYEWPEAYQMVLKPETQVSLEEMDNDIALEATNKTVLGNIENNKVYHASPKKFDVISGKKSNTPNAKNSVFVSPFKHFASMFIFDFQAIVDEIETQIGKKHISIDNFGFEEWNKTPSSTTSIPSKVHILVRTPESFKSFKGKATGYLYTIDFNKYKDKADMWSHAKDSDVELIIRGDVHYEKCEEITMEYEVVKDTRSHATEDLDVSVTLLQEFNVGIEEFNRWVRDLELKYLRDELNDEQVTMAFEQIAQESILTDTVKTIFRKIGEFIGWFLRKLKELWNYFFGKTQRATRALKAANERITRHNNSNGFFNDAAFNGSKAPQGLVNAIGLDKFITMGFSPDEFYTLFNEMLDMWASHPEDLYEEIFVRFNQSPTTHKWHTLIGILPTGSGPNAMDAVKFTKSKYPASGTMRESAYDKESVIILLKEAMDAVIAYEKNSKLIASKGNIAAEAAKRVMEYQDRTDITEHEAMQMAKEIQELGNYLQVVFKCYQKAYEFILEQTNEVAKVYLQFMK